MQDALFLFSSALDNLSNSTDLVAERLSCDQSEQVSSHGERIKEELLSSETEGNTGTIRFSGKKLDNLRIHLMKWNGKRIDKVGEFNTNSQEMMMSDLIETPGKPDVMIYVLVSLIISSDNHTIVFAVQLQRKETHNRKSEENFKKQFFHIGCQCQLS